MTAASDSGSTVSVLDQVLADLAAESAALEALVARPRRVRVAYGDPCGRLGRRDAGGPPRLDRRGGRGSSDGQGGLGRVRPGRDRGPHGLHRRRGAGRRCRRAGGAAGPVAAGAGRPGTGTARLPRRAEDAVVRSADEPHVDGDGSLHGDLGARARRRRRAGHQARAHRPDPSGRAPRCPHAQLRLRHARPGTAREEFRIELVAPSGELWAWGPEDAAQRVTGSAYDFCLRVTQRRHRDDLDLVATGPDADRWLDIAQAFAGPPGEGRQPS